MPDGFVVDAVVVILYFESGVRMELGDGEIVELACTVGAYCILAWRSRAKAR